jgi:hypothetical protein
VTQEQLKWIANYPDCDTIEMNPQMVAAIEECGSVIDFAHDLSTEDVTFWEQPKRLNGRQIVQNVNQGKTTLTFKRGSKPLAVVTFCEEIL